MYLVLIVAERVKPTGAPTSAERYYLLNILFSLGVRRIGINFAKSFIHFDIDETLTAPVIFEY